MIITKKKSSYAQIKTEVINIPEFAQHVKHQANATKPAAVTEFMHDSPAPMLNKNEAAILIKRFWGKLSKAASGNDIEIIDDFVAVDGDFEVTESSSELPLPKTSKIEIATKINEIKNNVLLKLL